MLLCFFGSQNADPDVRVDAETFLNKTVPEVASDTECLCLHHASGSAVVVRKSHPPTVGMRQGRGAPWIHTDEGPDDMPAHLKSSMFGCQLTIPITKGRLNTGTWQVREHLSLFLTPCLLHGLSVLPSDDGMWIFHWRWWWPG